ncbi:hypothetical protein ACFYE8_34925 [Rhizobium leguminosarum]|uniref:hypothetical protein n=1 Tax=Rhizobium leguminosarum TaxID=384 RepID=UPI0036DCE246
MITPPGRSLWLQIAFISTVSRKPCADEGWIMNFKGISAPLNAGRLEQMLGLAPSRRDPETQDASDKPSGNEAVRGLETENLYRSSVFK